MQTPLYAWHRSHGAKIVPFAGWDMPLHYHTGAIEEHHLVRRSVGLFDISHMGRLLFSGPNAAGALDRLVTCDVRGLASGYSTYGLLCRDDGTTIDDVFVYRFEDDYLVVVNAANRDRDVAWIQQHIKSDGVTWSDESEALSMIAVQGPVSLSVLDAMSGGTASSVPRFGCATITIAGESMRFGRTGYTGEDGVELFPEAGVSEKIWDAFFEYGAAQSVEIGPCGLASRDSLRFEPGFHLYGHELTDETTPVEARLKWACNLEKDFIGRDAIARIAKEGTDRRLETVVMTERAVPREGYAVLDTHGERIGVVVSGMYAPTLECYAANVYVERDYAKVGTKLAVEVRGRAKMAEVAKRPLYKAQYK